MPSAPLFINTFQHDRKFGIELEFYNITTDKVGVLLEGAGVGCYSAYGEGDDEEGQGSRWKITDDGSIVGNDSVELVSPILSGIKGLREVAKVVNILARAGAEVNKSCGFHVHVDARDLSGKVLLNVFRRYALHEDQIDAFMPPSRRGNSNSFCYSTRVMLDRTYQLSDDMNCNQISSLMNHEEWSGSCYTGGRYYKVNLCAWLRHGTIEFRHHAGTMNVQKVMNWICFCVNFVETSIDSETAQIWNGVHADSVEFFANRVAALV